MKIKILYHSRSGNTRKVAEAMAKALNVDAGQVPPGYPIENLDLLFLGGGIYMGKIDSKLEYFISTLNPGRAKNVAVFGTSGGPDNGIKRIKELLSKQGVNVIDESFLCKGRYFFFFCRKYPSDEDLKNAQEFAGRVAAKIKG